MRMLVALLLLSGLTYAQDDPKKQAEKEAEAKAKEKIDAFKATVKKAKTNDDFIGAIDGLGDMQHPLILAELKAWLGKPTPEIRQAAAEEIGKFKGDEKAASALCMMAKNDKIPDVAIKCLLEMGKIACKKTARELVGFFARKEWEVAREAVDSCAAIKSKTVISPLITFLEDLETEKERVKQAQNSQQAGGQGGQLPGGGGQLPGGQAGGTNSQTDLQDRQKRVDELIPRVVQALKDITDEKLNTAKEWRKYEMKNRGFFKDDEEKKDDKKEEKKDEKK